MSRGMPVWAILLGVMGMGACVTVLTVRRRRVNRMKRCIRRAGKILMKMPSVMMRVLG